MLSSSSSLPFSEGNKAEHGTVTITHLHPHSKLCRGTMSALGFMATASGSKRSYKLASDKVARTKSGGLP